MAKLRSFFPWFLAWLLVVFTAQMVDADDIWTALNYSVNGRLYRAEPFSKPCFTIYNGNLVSSDEAACSLVGADYTNNTVHVNEPVGYMYLQSEVCLSDPSDQCLLDPATTSTGVPSSYASCNQGSVPDYYIEVQSELDVAAGLEFAKANSMPLSIKNSGHDFMTRNSQKGSLALWLHKLKGMTYHDDFQPEGSNESVGRAMTVAAGELTGDVFEFASDHGSMILSGYSPTIALSGGYIQGGGHGVLAPVLGLAADRVVEFKIVTPDGVIRTANSHQNTDLFKALRGGGGGTFGVVLEATHRVEPVAPIAVAAIQLPSDITVDTSKDWIELQARESLRWGKDGWGGHVAGTYLTYMNPLPSIANLSDRGAAARESMRNATQFAQSVGGTSVVEVLPDWLDVWNKYGASVTSNSAGRIRLVTSRLLPQHLFASEEGITKVMEYVDEVYDLGFDPRELYVPVNAPFVANDAMERMPKGQPGTSVHPAWYNALWEISASVNVPWNATFDDRVRNLTALAKWTKLQEDLAGPGSGTYMNEANPFTQNWKDSWWGSHYEELLETKKKYDPDGLLKCWKCVGFEDADVESDRFKCMGKLQQAVDGNNA
ncbi:uncharacterized protein BCR38DRAFT_489876 [Pseudomassariella vexata]|uniref:FAD-binding PCMH-type domain-containing protein n=1 Tax=Pseudomassariella vexata TaxID=1141098 RepID=A0A1Y2DF26_9PEZI|nr:uncharacterized protein BCR38DRAFT_489876 [Pseudomassariella vexata]ORY57880.1 hypothetical protein BCR38DRAFT_489876 [Pseudomassariella vexata]